MDGRVDVVMNPDDQFTVRQFICHELSCRLLGNNKLIWIQCMCIYWSTVTFTSYPSPHNIHNNYILKSSTSTDAERFACCGDSFVDFV